MAWLLLAVIPLGGGGLVMLVDNAARKAALHAPVDPWGTDQ